mgnify:CR=1 FL=1
MTVLLHLQEKRNFMLQKIIARKKEDLREPFMSLRVVPQNFFV